MTEERRNLFLEPLCRPEDLGAALPDLPHAVSMCLPTWESVIGYEERDPEVMKKLACGYPRFVSHPEVGELCAAAEAEFARKGEKALVFPSLAAAWRAADFVKQKSGAGCRLESYGWENLTVVLVEPAGFEAAWKVWQHGGEIVSSRNAEAALTDEPLPDDLAEAGQAARERIRTRIGLLTGESTEDIFLFSSGMAAIAAVHRAALRRRPGLPTVQVEFPYVDALKAQQHFNPGGVIDLSVAEHGGAAEVKALLGRGESLAAVFTEAPSNPLLRTADLAGLRRLLEPVGTPLFVDDTVATPANVDALRFADAVTGSLTKLFSGAGDVMAGSVTLKGDSPFHDELREALVAAESDSPLFALDAIMLEQNSRDFLERLPVVNANGEIVFDFLDKHPAIERLWYPKRETAEFYEAVLKPGGGYGGLMSLLLKDAPRAAPKFYDALEISKGPSLGTNFSLACPYTLLAHYGELPWAAQCGVDANLVRLWIGLEPVDELIERLDRALAT
ncbi:MAG: PLP-dependent transferase [Verrucomicrobiae bacterium]|nr:PLP-dependent transferase [Verrucomicrobiae bacterium]